MQSTSGPLDGVRVVDLTAALAGPFCTMILADLGAEVIKVEPETGDVTRRVGPFPKDAEDGLGGYFQSVNRGKSSVVLDLKSEAGRRQLDSLLESAHVLVENFGPGVVERLGITYEQVHARFPSLVYASLSGFGGGWAGESPYAHWPAMDITIQAMAGALSITGLEDGSPVKIGPGIGDIFPGTMLAIGLLAALRHAERTGEGQEIEVSMYDSMLSLCERIVYQYSYTGLAPQPIGNTHPILTPFDVLQASDGWVAIAATTQPRWEALCRIMGRLELIADERFTSERERSRHTTQIRAIVQEWIGARTKAELTELLGGRVAFAPVNNAADIFGDPHPWARSMLVEVENPGSAQKAVIAGCPIKFSRTPSSVRRRAPLLDEDHARLLDPVAPDS